MINTKIHEFLNVTSPYSTKAIQPVKISATTTLKRCLRTLCQ